MILLAHHGLCQLVGAGCAFVAAEVARELGSNFVRRHALAQFRDCFEIAVASALKRNVVNSIFVIALKVNDFGAGAARFISYFLHNRRAIGKDPRGISPRESFLEFI